MASNDYLVTNSKRPSSSIQVLLVSLAHVRVLASLPAAASCRRRLRSRVPAFSLCVFRRRDLVCAMAWPFLGLALAVRRSRSSSCSLRCWPSASPPGLWMQELVCPSSALSLRVTYWRLLRSPQLSSEVTSRSPGLLAVRLITSVPGPSPGLLPASLIRTVTSWSPWLLAARLIGQGSS